MQQSQSIGFIGAGRMGRPMMLALLKEGYTVNVYDKYKSAAETVIAAGATWSNTPKTVADKCDVLITCLALPEHVKTCMLGIDGALEGMKAGSTWINMSTTDYQGTMQIAECARDKGIFCLEGPVSNISHMGVDFGNSSIFCAGDKEAYEATQQILDVITKISFFTGEIGTAQTIKLFTNLIFYGEVLTCSDSLAIAYQAGIPIHWIWDKIKASSATSLVTEQFIPMLLDGSYDTSCSLEIGVKDMMLTVALADEKNIDLHLGRAVNSRYKEAGNAYDQQLNHLAVCKLTEDANNIKVRITDFIAPSKYGADSSYIRSNKMKVDKLGRQTPKVTDYRYNKAFVPDQNQKQLVDKLLNFLEFTNYTLIKEAYALGKAVGLDQNLIKKTILWSVGSNWVIENLTDYQPNEQAIQNMSEINIGLDLPFIDNVLNVLG